MASWFVPRYARLLQSLRFVFSSKICIKQHIASQLSHILSFCGWSLPQTFITDVSWTTGFCVPVYMKFFPWKMQCFFKEWSLLHYQDLCQENDLSINSSWTLWTRIISLCYSSEDLFQLWDFFLQVELCLSLQINIPQSNNQPFLSRYQLLSVPTWPFNACSYFFQQFMEFFRVHLQVVKNFL